MAERFASVSEVELCEKCIIKQLLNSVFRMISWIIKPSCLCYLPQPSASADNTDLGFDISWYHAQPHPIIVYWKCLIWLPCRWFSLYFWANWRQFQKCCLKWMSIKQQLLTKATTNNHMINKSNRSLLLRPLANFIYNNINFNIVTIIIIIINYQSP